MSMLSEPSILTRSYFSSMSNQRPLQSLHRSTSMSSTTTRSISLSDIGQCMTNHQLMSGSLRFQSSGYLTQIGHSDGFTQVRNGFTDLVGLRVLENRRQLLLVNVSPG